MRNCNSYIILIRCRAIIAVLACTIIPFSLLSPTAQAQNHPTTNQIQHNEPGPLAGPQIDRQPSAPGVTMGFSKAGRKREPNNRARVRLYENIIVKLNLPPSQYDAIKAIYDEYKTQNRAFYQKHQDEITQLKTTIRNNQPSDKSAPPPDKSTTKITDAKLSPEALTARKRMRKIQAGHPQADPYLLEIWNLLTPDQQEQFRTKATELKRTAYRRKAEQGKLDTPDTRPFMERRREFIDNLLAKEGDQLTKQDKIMLKRIRNRMKRQQQNLTNYSAPQPPKASDIIIEKTNSKP